MKVIIKGHLRFARSEFKSKEKLVKQTNDALKSQTDNYLL